MTRSGQRQPVSLRVSVTDRCQLRCLYCMPADGISKRPRSELLTFDEIIRFVQAVRQHFELSKVHITGGDPLARRGIVRLVEMLADESACDLALTTNGLRLSEMAGDLRRAGLRRVNVSLDSLDAETFALMTRGGVLQQVVDGIEAARSAGLSPIKLNTVVLRGMNDGEAPALAKWALDRQCTIRFLELMPVGCAKSSFQELFVPTAEVRVRIEEHFELEALPYEPGRSSRDFSATDNHGRRGVIGFISPETQPFCRGCRRLRLTSTGRLITCLARGQGPDIAHLLRDDSPQATEALNWAICSQMLRKQARDAFDTARSMAAVGG